MIQIPSNYFFTILPILSCNLRCPWCIQGHEDPKKQIINNLPQLSTQQWIDGIKNHFQSDSFCVISGGEVLQRDDIAKIAIEISDNFHHVDVGTNLQIDPSKFIQEIQKSGKKNIRIGTSYHPGQTNLKLFLMNLRKVLKSQINLIDVVIVNTPDGKGKEAVDKLYELKIPEEKLMLVPFQGKWKNEIYPLDNEFCQRKYKKKVNCKTSLLVISPNGNVYNCSTRAYRNLEPITNILNIDEDKIKSVIKEGIECSICGECQPCNSGRIFPVEIKD